MEENKKDVLPLEGEPLTAPQISEPVVNALAAALSKIETYVPTQYIDDGPPDIDADHLNHAEQAIMRVTNLANGAADAIAALQSQVTQLNNNFQYKELTNDFDLNNALGKYRTDSSIIITSLKNKPSEIRNSGEATIDWYPANERNTYGIQIMRWTYGNTHMIFTRNKIENTWAEWVQYVTKSDLDNKIQCGLSSIGEISPGESTSEITFPHSFTTAPKSVVGNIRYVGYGDSLSMQIAGITTTGFSVYIHNTSSRKVSIAIYWIACLN